MKTWLNREGVYVSEKPKEYFMGKDAHGNNVYIGDICEHRENKRVFRFKVFEGDYFSSKWFISKSILKNK